MTVAISLVAVASAGCIGAANRTEFRQMVQERGGGVSNAAVAGVIDRLEVETGQDPLVRSARFDFSNDTASFEVRSGEHPGEVDSYYFSGGRLSNVTPVRLAANEDLEASTRRLSTFAFDKVENMADRALAEFNSSGGYVTGMTALVAEDALVFNVESPRATATALFDAQGNFQVMQR